jgi:cytochrome oxidase assembly protein ShyY1
VTAEGTYVADRTVVVENRTYTDDSPGGWVLTPLDLGGGRSVLVNRGFVGLDEHGRVVAPPAPTGEVQVTGLLFPSQRRGHFGAVDPAAGVLTVVARVDLERIDAQVDGSLLPAYVQLTDSRPGEPAVATGTPAIRPLGPPEVSEGPHFSYAVQWGIFSTIAAVGYVLLLRKVAKEQEEEQRRDRASEVV